MYNILIVEDHPMMADAIKASIKTLIFKTRVYVASTLSELQTNARIQEVGSFNLIIADLGLPDSEGLMAFHILRSSYPLSKILIFSQIDDPRVAEQLVRLGAEAYVAKSNQPKILIQRIQDVLSDLDAAKTHRQPHESIDDEQIAADPVHVLINKLTTQHRKVLQLLASGLSSTEIAAQLEVNEPTVRTHLTEIYRRLKVKNRAQAIVLYLRWASINDL